MLPHVFMLNVYTSGSDQYNLPNLPSIFPRFFFFFFLNGVTRIKYLCYRFYAKCLDKWV